MKIIRLFSLVILSFILIAQFNYAHKLNMKNSVDEDNNKSKINDTNSENTKKENKSDVVPTLKKEGNNEESHRIGKNCGITNIKMHKGEPVISYSMRLDTNEEMNVYALSKKTTNDLEFNKSDLVHTEESNNGFLWVKPDEIPEKKFLKFRSAFNACRKLNTESLDKGLFKEGSNDKNLYTKDFPSGISLRKASNNYA